MESITLHYKLLTLYWTNSSSVAMFPSSNISPGEARDFCLATDFVGEGQIKGRSTSRTILQDKRAVNRDGTKK